MVRHWINELMNLLAGNSRYITYTGSRQRLFLLVLLLVLLIPIVLLWLA